MNINGTAIRVVSEILDNGLANSIWVHDHIAAYSDLLEFRRDMEASVVLVLDKVIAEEKAANG